MPTAIERRSQAIALLQSNPHLTRQQIAAQMGLKRKTVSNYLLGSGMGAKVRRRWTPEEEALLERRSERDTVEQLARKLNRTPISIMGKAALMGLSLRPCLNNYSAKYLAENLGIHRACVVNWINRGLLKARHARKGKRYAIAQSDFADFVRQYPEKVGKVDPEALNWLTGK